MCVAQRSDIIAQYVKKSKYFFSFFEKFLKEVEKKQNCPEIGGFPVKNHENLQGKIKDAKAAAAGASCA